MVNAALTEGLLLAPIAPKVLRFVSLLIVMSAEVEKTMILLDKAIANVKD